MGWAAPLVFALADTAKLRWDAPLHVLELTAGPETIYGARLADDVMLGRHVFQKPFAWARAQQLEAPQAPMIGSQVLQNFYFTLDQAHGRARFMRSESDPVVIPDPRGGPPPGTTGGTTQGKRGK